MPENVQKSRCQGKLEHLKMDFLLLMAEILHQLIGSLSHYLQVFLHPRWLFGISSINSTATYREGFLLVQCIWDCYCLLAGPAGASQFHGTWIAGVFIVESIWSIWLDGSSKTIWAFEWNSLLKTSNPPKKIPNNDPEWYKWRWFDWEFLLESILKNSLSQIGEFFCDSPRYWSWSKRSFTDCYSQLAISDTKITFQSDVFSQEMKLLNFSPSACFFSVA